MKIGDVKRNAVVKFTGNYKKDVLACFDNLAEQEEEQRIVDTERKKREVNESAKKRF